MDEKKTEIERPVSAFLTFTTQEGYERCLNNFETEKDWLGFPIFKKSSV